MTAEGHKVVSLHGKQEPAERDQVMNDFKTGKSKVLISTNVIARGIDVLQVNVVVKWVFGFRLPSLLTQWQLRPPYGPGQQARCRDLHPSHRFASSWLSATEVSPTVTGRTGRFGRQGLSINFVHDRRSFEVMQQIEAATGRNIIKVETSDFDEMEKVLPGRFEASDLD
jgi:ATP-dependent RNA helicase DDX19/DBP5